MRVYDTSRLTSGNHGGLRNQVEFPPGLSIQVTNEGAKHIRNLSLDLFRKKLVEHFDTMLEMRALQWPRLNCKRPNIERI